jgi:hypothetical protein
MWVSGCPIAAIAALLDRYPAYRAADDFVGMDRTRKYLQMGYTRPRRYALQRGGRKYHTDGTRSHACRMSLRSQRQEEILSSWSLYVTTKQPGALLRMILTIVGAKQSAGRVSMP